MFYQFTTSTFIEPSFNSVALRLSEIPTACQRLCTQRRGDAEELKQYIQQWT